MLAVKEIDSHMLLQCLQRMEDRVQERGLARFDPTDVASNNLFARMASCRLSAVSQSVRLCELFFPWTTRSLLRIKRRVVPTTLYHLGMTYLNWEKIGTGLTVNANCRLDNIVDQALEARAVGEHVCFEHPHEVHGSQWRDNSLTRENIPRSCAHHTARLGSMFLHVGRWRNNQELQRLAVSAADALIDYHNWHEHEGSVNTVSYYPDTDDEVINTGAEVSALLLLLPHSLATERHRKKGLGLLEMVIQEQSEEGSWGYTTQRHNSLLGYSQGPDNHHTAMNIKALAEVLAGADWITLAKKKQISNCIDRAVSFYIEKLSCPVTGKFLMYPSSRREANIAGYCEGMLMLDFVAKNGLATSDMESRLRTIINRAAERVLSAFYCDGDVCSQLRFGKSYNIHSIRWGSGLLMEAISALLVSAGSTVQAKCVDCSAA